MEIHPSAHRHDITADDILHATEHSLLVDDSQLVLIGPEALAARVGLA